MEGNLVPVQPSRNGTDGKGVERTPLTETRVFQSTYAVRRPKASPADFSEPRVACG